MASAKEGIRIITDPEGLDRVVVELYVDDIALVVCYFKSGTSIRNVNQACKELMESTKYGYPFLQDQL